MQKPLKILICDDDSSIRSVVRQILCGSDNSVFQCQGVGTFKQCIEICEANETDYVILDLDLPDKLGFEGLKELHERFKHIGIIIFTGHHSQSDAVRAVNEYGVLAYITKPIEDINQFYNAITSAIIRHNNEKKVDSKVGFKDLKVWAGVATAILSFLTAIAVFGEKLVDFVKALFTKQ